MIPGAFEARPRPTTDRAIGVPVVPAAAATVSSDPQRLEREREGGGAPSERDTSGRVSLLGRLFNAFAGKHR